MPRIRRLKVVDFSEAHGHFIVSQPDHAGKLYKIPRAARDLGLRIGKECSDLGVSIGHAAHLFIVLVPTLELGEIKDSPYQAYVLYTYVIAGLPLEFNDACEADKLSRLKLVTLAAIRHLSNQNLEIDRLEQQIGRQCS
eukprot:TRINITY_DN59072_c0_g2_i2.p1 TRINITY_DN59072_c0_g2~~TRINITY_DN59072_c0_g2_i2.p1  ORF type:complete len:139 (+),score=18.70 TRINITY_DN59072_c0_g2_i2:411-827(+)